MFIDVHAAGRDDGPLPADHLAVGQPDFDVVLAADRPHDRRAVLPQGQCAAPGGGVDEGPRIGRGVDAGLVGKPDAGGEVGCFTVGGDDAVSVPPLTVAVEPVQEVVLES